MSQIAATVGARPGRATANASIRFPIPTAKPRESERAAPTLAAPLTICTPPGRASKRRSWGPDNRSFGAEIEEPGLLVCSQSATLTAGSLVPLASTEAQIRRWPDASSHEKLRSTGQIFRVKRGKETAFKRDEGGKDPARMAFPTCRSERRSLSRVSSWRGAETPAMVEC